MTAAPDILVNNLNDGMAWGLFPLFFAGPGLDLGYALGALTFASGATVAFRLRRTARRPGGEA